MGRQLNRHTICPTPGCPNIHPNKGKCPTCRRQADHHRRPHGNPYTTPGHQQFRQAILKRDPNCVCKGDCGQHTTTCNKHTTTADHHPTERRDLIKAGLNPNNPAYGRGLCTQCHNHKTARTKPAGWNKPT